MAKKLMKGCEAIAEAAIQAGCRFFFGYPITPQNDIPEYYTNRRFVSILLPSEQRPDTIRLQIETYNGPLERIFVP